MSLRLHHTLMMQTEPSSLPEKTVRPSWDTHRSCTASECATQLRTQAPLRPSHRRTTPSLAPLRLVVS